MDSEKNRSYGERNKRIGLDVPIALRESLYSFVPPGMLSPIVRGLLNDLVRLSEQKGPKEVIIAALNNRLKISIDDTT